MNPSRVVAAIAVLALAAGTALAASPSPEPSASAAASQGEVPASASVAASAVPESAAQSIAAATPNPAKASEAPETETPETETPETETPEAPPTAAEAADIVARLKAAGISTTVAAFQSLAAKVGTGGAVRTLAFAQASGQTPAQIVALWEGGKGWGQIKKDLGLKIGPGIGWIMSGGHGKGHSK